MNNHRRPQPARVAARGALALAALLCAAPLQAGEIRLTGESTTFLRMKKTTDDRDSRPLYEYLDLGVGTTLADGAGLDLYTGAWGRADLADRSGDDRRDGDLRYGYLSYRGTRNNAVASLGRQLVTEGVASERIDGLYLRSDLTSGFGASAFAGSSVLSDKDREGGSFTYGARVSHGDRRSYSIGLSGLRSEGNGFDRFREEYGADIWLQPAARLDLSGRSTYNAATAGWMEHSYAATVAATDAVQVGAEFANINYRDYFYNMTSNAFRFAGATGGIINPSEELLSAGATVSCSPVKALDLAADYKHFSYKIAGRADYFGARAGYALNDSTRAGLVLHRMQGSDDSRLRYMETGAFVTTAVGKATLAANIHNVWYDREINGLRNSYVITGSAGYALTGKLKLGADLEFARSPYFDSETRGLVKATYAFDATMGDRGTKSEK